MSALHCPADVCALDFTKACDPVGDAGWLGSGERCAMLELMRRPHAEGLADICLRVPSWDALRISKVIADVLVGAGARFG